jgi:hypothetical protein
LILRLYVGERPDLLLLRLGQGWEAMWTLLTIAIGAFAYSRFGLASPE